MGVEHVRTDARDGTTAELYQLKLLSESLLRQ